MVATLAPHNVGKVCWHVFAVSQVKQQEEQATKIGATSDSWVSAPHHITHSWIQMSSSMAGAAYPLQICVMLSNNRLLCDSFRQAE